MGEKRGRQALIRLRERSRQRTEGAAEREPAVVSCDEMGTTRWDVCGGAAAAEKTGGLDLNGGGSGD